MPQKEIDKADLIAAAEELLGNKHLNKALMDSLPYPAMLIRKDRKIIIANKVARELGVEAGSYCWDTFGKKVSISQEDKGYYEKNRTVPSTGIHCVFCKADEALTSHMPINEKITAGDITYDTYWVPLAADIYLHYTIIL